MICRKMGLRISGDTVIRMLLDFADRRPAPVCGESIGVDDFAYRKGHSHCTAIVNEEDRVILDIPEGRDGGSLREWLKEIRHVRTVTRDRAGAYAKAISEILPDAMQIADRFHLHQNLMECVKDVLKANLPAHVKIPKEDAADPSDMEDAVAASESKKNQELLPLIRSDVSRRERYTEIFRLREHGHTYKQIAFMLNVSKRTISIVLNGDIEHLCRDSRTRALNPYLNKIAEGIQTGKTVIMLYVELGYPGGRTNFYNYTQELAKRLGLSLAKSKRTPELPADGVDPVQTFEYLKRSRIFHCLWDEKAFSEEQRRYLEENHPVVMELQKRIREFRLIFEQ